MDDLHTILPLPPDGSTLKDTLGIYSIHIYIELYYTRYSSKEYQNNGKMHKLVNEWQ